MAKKVIREIFLPRMIRNVVASLVALQLQLKPFMHELYGGIKYFKGVRHNILDRGPNIMGVQIFRYRAYITYPQRNGKEVVQFAFRSSVESWFRE